MSLPLLYVGWCGLGVYRGVKLYTYENSAPLYSNAILYGLGGFSVYVNPVLLPFTLHKEFYRVGVFVRGGERTRRYYDLI